MRYTAKYFKDNLPGWKRKKDSLLAKLLYRPISFGLASIAANLGISANAVSYTSVIIAVIGCALFLLPNQICHISGAVLMIVWIILDCIDGNLARCVKKQPFGEFADSMSSYFLVGFMGMAMGITVYFEGGLLVEEGNPWIIFLGALASSSDTMMRLIYQKYKNTERKLADQGIVEIETDFREEQDQPNTIKLIVDREFGLDIIPIIILVSSIFKTLDIAIFYCLIYYGGAFAANLVIYIRKAVRAVKRSKQISEKTIR